MLTGHEIGRGPFADRCVLHKELLRAAEAGIEPASEIDGPLLTAANSRSKCNTTRKKGGDLEYFAVPQTTKNEEELVKYHQITQEERYRISALRREGSCPAAIARRIGRHRSTVSRELQRNRSPWDGSYRYERRAA